MCGQRRAPIVRLEVSVSKWYQEHETIFASISQQRSTSHPHSCEGFQIVLVGTRDNVLIPAPYPQFVLSSRTGTNFFDKGGIDQNGTVNANEAISLEFIGSPRNRFL